MGDGVKGISGNIEKAIAIVVITLVLLVMTNPIVDAVDDVNTTDWDFTGYEGAIILLDLIPFLWVAAILSAAAYSMFRLARG